MVKDGGCWHAQLSSERGGRRVGPEGRIKPELGVKTKIYVVVGWSHHGTYFTYFPETMVHISGRVEVTQNDALARALAITV